jgi:hypothetical protein
MQVGDCIEAAMEIHLAEDADIHAVCNEIFRATSPLPLSVSPAAVTTSPTTEGRLPLLPRLSEDSWEGLQRDGFVVVDRFLSREQATALAAAAEELHSDGRMWSPRQPNRDDLLLFLRRRDATATSHTGLKHAIDAMVHLQAELATRLRLSGGYECQLARFAATATHPSQRDQRRDEGGGGSIGFERHRDELPVGFGHALAAAAAEGRDRATTNDAEREQAVAPAWSEGEEDEEEGLYSSGDSGSARAAPPLPRRVSAIVYGEGGWQPEDGGCLRLFVSSNSKRPLHEGSSSGDAAAAAAAAAAADSNSVLVEPRGGACPSNQPVRSAYCTLCLD